MKGLKDFRLILDIASDLKPLCIKLIKELATMIELKNALFRKEIER